jgi:hypothetical protein
MRFSFAVNTFAGNGPLESKNLISGAVQIIGSESVQSGYCFSYMVGHNGFELLPSLRKTEAYQRLQNDLNLFRVDYTS